MVVKLNPPCSCGNTPSPGDSFDRSRHCAICTAFSESNEWPPRPITEQSPVTPTINDPATRYPPKRENNDCVHLGNPLTGPERNNAGLDHRRLWHYCLHPKKPLGVHVCPCAGCGVSCPGYVDELSTLPSRRHLAFHVYPDSRQNGVVWRMAVDQLRLRWPLFTGTRAVAVSTGGGLESPETVRKYLPQGCDVVEVPNDPGLREVATWQPLWDRVLRDAGDRDRVLYCHAKGVTRNLDPGNSTHWWASLCWSLVLDHWPLVEKLLDGRPIAGPFKKVGLGFGPGFGTWHYSGTFYWVNAGDAKWRLDNVPVPRQWWGTEAWPGLAYDPGEAATIFMDGVVPSLDVYSPQFWDSTIRPRYQEWLIRNPPDWAALKSPAGNSPSAGG